VLADIWEAKERGKAVAFFSLGPPIAPNIAPLIAGWIALRTSWRWIMWVLVMFCGFVLVLGTVLLEETFAPTILAKKAKRLRKETGNKDLMTIFEATEADETMWRKVGKTLTRPAMLLGGNLIVFVLSLFMALVYGNKTC
jgi:MFS family permease